MTNTNQQALSVYLVDDDQDDQQLFQDALSELSHPIDLSVMNNGVELMDKLFSETRQPDIVFLDLHMPMMNGEECLQDIRDEERFDGIPVLIYSNTSDTDQLKRLFEMGANRFLRKPASFSELVSSLDGLLHTLVKKGMGGSLMVDS